MNSAGAIDGLIVEKLGTVRGAAFTRLIELIGTRRVRQPGEGVAAALDAIAEGGD